MIHQIVAIRDRAIDAFGQPAFTPSVGHAIRSFGDQINKNSEGNSMYEHPEDFDLYHLGEYDAENGQFKNLEKPQQVAIGKSLAIRKE